MRMKSTRRGSLAEYVSEILKNAVYEKGERLDVVVAEAPDLPGCLTQGSTIEQARENLEIAEGRYKTGVGNIIELTDAQASLTTAEASHVQALYAYKTAVAAVERATATRLASD